MLYIVGMTLNIQIEMDNAAFTSNGIDLNLDEIRRILGRVIAQMDPVVEEQSSYLSDCNGNRVGNWSID
jgi:hypothetical protein